MIPHGPDGGNGNRSRTPLAVAFKPWKALSAFGQEGPKRFLGMSGLRAMVNARVTVGERLRPRPFPGPAEVQDDRSPFSGGGFLVGDLA
jgi:hypothetical protein